MYEHFYSLYTFRTIQTKFVDLTLIGNETVENWTIPTKVDGEEIIMTIFGEQKTLFKDGKAIQFG